MIDDVYKGKQGLLTLLQILQEEFGSNGVINFLEGREFLEVEEELISLVKKVLIVSSQLKFKYANQNNQEPVFRSNKTGFKPTSKL